MMVAIQTGFYNVYIVLITIILVTECDALKCKYNVWQFRCSDKCCWRLSFKVAECLPCTWKFYLPCGRYLNPPVRRNMLPTATQPDKDRSNWMAGFQSKTLKQLVLPGSHHSGVNRAPGRHPVDAWDIPQTMTIPHQLRAGIRFLDLRVATAPFLLRPAITHNYRYQDFRNVIRDVANFLMFHTKEVVVIRLIGPAQNVIYYGFFEYDWRIDQTLVDKVLQTYHTFIYSGPNPLNRPLSALAGKMIICQQGGSSIYRTMDCQGSFSSTQTTVPAKLDGTMTNWITNVQTERASSNKFYFLEAFCTITDDEIRRSIIPKLVCFRSGNQALYIHRDLADLSQDCNFVVFNWAYFRKNLRQEVEAVMTDYVNPKIIDAIIRRNNPVAVGWWWKT